MPYKSREDQQAASARHYAAKPEKYNQQRRTLRHDGSALIDELLRESCVRWISPQEIRSRFDALAGDRKTMREQLWSRLEKKHNGAHLVGLFMGAVPFGDNDELLGKLYSSLPKFPKDNAKVELMILSLTLKGIANGR